MVSDIGCGDENVSAFKVNLRTVIEGIHPQSVPFSKLLYCQQFSGAACPTFSSFKATVDSTVIDFMLDHLKEKMPVSF